MLDSATAATAHPTAWWSAGLAPHESGAQRPAWAEYIERSTATTHEPEAATGDWQHDLLRCLAPLLATARNDLLAAGHTGPVTDQFLQRLGHRLLKLSARTLVLELHRARVRGDLTGATPNERFLDFTHRLAGGSELADLLAEYPVLARILGEACRQSVAAHHELLTRLAEDRELLVTTLFHGRDPGELAGVDPGGDPHRGGRCTTVLTFADGRKVVYKPRPLDLHEHFNQIVDWLNSRTAAALRTVRIVRRPGYGWMEFIEHAPCDDLAAVRRFYHRQGALLALLYVLDGTDMHHENLIAGGDQPVLVDVETLFHPAMASTGPLGQDPAHTALLSSVSRTALLPLMVVGEHGAADLSGIGGDDGVAPHEVVDWADAGLDSMHLVRRAGKNQYRDNRPTLRGSVTEPRDHEVSLLAGFRSAYEAIARHRAELLGPAGLLTRCSADEIRYVPRPSRIYATLLDESTHPTALHDADGHSSLLDLLWDANQELRQVVPSELADLWSGNIPLFTTRPQTRDVWASDGTRVPGLLRTEGLAAVEAKVAAMGEVDQDRQCWVISASLATRPAPVLHSSTATRPGLGTAEADPEQLLAAATDIADEVMAQVLGDNGSQANWLGLELLDDHHWTILPMGAGLTNGYLGTALFLAQTGVLTGATKYCELAYDAIRPIPQVLEVLAASPDAGQTVGAGLHGLGGISYGLSRLAELLDDSSLLSWLDLSLQLMENAASRSEGVPSYVEGAAGGLTAVQAIGSGPRTTKLAAQYADELLAAVNLHLQQAEPAGFARGYAGIAWALGHYAAADSQYHHAARVAVERAEQTTAANPGWCSGQAGTLLAGLRAGGPVDLDAYLRHATERPMLADLSLCHGELGAVEPLLWLTERDHPAVAAVRRRRAGLVLAAVQQHGPQCGTPRAVPSPGLLTGLAGIGYGLLRLGFHGQIPSVLLQEPARPAPITAPAGHQPTGETS
ncbi:Lanthionine synthetase C family protein [Kribbella flavida DSM 17836]|uniref:Lanthionine synthetase C family protein n=1 Tax=Kribbella flavida (strain DSM 17836 / JCM 10339 / NBRC 14399) TaxID=479435 RepID=D2PYF6_KRIFD|nr:type 2 lanthipeptide synthetase LanM family protein [Kribbella flavida]ADB35524.1 Lanthionine synthetase C family protein [Kribbella flavida DSM 17836]